MCVKHLVERPRAILFIFILLFLNIHKYFVGMIFHLITRVTIVKKIKNKVSKKKLCG